MLPSGNSAVTCNDAPSGTVFGHNPSSLIARSSFRSPLTAISFGECANTASGASLGGAAAGLVFALRCAALFPIHDQFQLFLGESLVVTEITEALNRAPGRHAPLQYLFSNGLGPRTRGTVGGQRKGCPAFAMTRYAMGVEQPDNLPVEGDLGRNYVMGIRRDGSRQYEKNPSDEHRS